MITIPTTTELFNAIIADLEGEFNITINPNGKSELRAMAATQAAKLKQMYLGIAAVQKNIFVDTCDDDVLTRFGLVKLNRQPFAAVAGQYSVLVTGQIGGIIAAGTLFKSNDSTLNPGILYVLDNAFTLTGTTGTITIRSLTIGLTSKLEIGDTLTATAPLPVVDQIATVTVEVVQPLAAETTENYRAAILNAFRLETQGGAATDYRVWSGDAQGVQTVYPYAKPNAPAELNLFIEATPGDSIDGKGTPSALIIADVESVVNFSPDVSLPLNERGRRPITAIVNYEPITPKTIDITITGFQGLTIPIENDLTAAFTTQIALIRPFVAAADLITLKNDIIDVNKLIGIIITAKPGSIFTSVSFTVDGVPFTTYQFVNGNIPYFNPTIVFN
jgi:hypothetical protein